MAEEKKSKKGLIIGISVATVVLIAVVVTIVLVLVLGKKDISGKYNLVNMESQGTSMNVETLTAFGMSIGLDIEKDGTGKMVSSAWGQTQETKFTYDKDKFVMEATEDVQSADVPYKLEGDTLTLEQDGTKMVFKKTDKLNVVNAEFDANTLVDSLAGAITDAITDTNEA